MKSILPTLLLLLLSFPIFSLSLPLSTHSRWIVEEQTGDRVKLKCANWPAHLQPMLAEGLDKRPMNLIARHISLMGFNCVRLTYATYMFTRHGNLTVAQSFHDLGLNNALKGIEKNNPRVLDLTVIDAFSTVIDELGSHGVMVLLDNQVSEPMWCCNDNDGNGFFGDEYFKPKEWLRGLATVARRYKETPMVVAMSLRNELRGPRQNVSEWYRWVRKGAKTIHKANPNVLVLISGLDYDLDFTPLKTNPLGLQHELGHKLVYETHRYAFTEGGTDAWKHQPTNQVCDSVIREVANKTGFLVNGSNPAPLFVTEFGVDQTGSSPADNLFLGCYMAYLVEMDLDWAIWALQGSYYLRDGIQDHDETYAMLDGNWTNLRSPKIHEQLYLIQQTLQDPKSNASNYTFMYHPLTGRCIRADNDEIYASDCHTLTEWTHAGDGTPIRLSGTPYCLTVTGDGLPVKLSTDCYNEQSTWKSVPNSRFQIANKDEYGTDLCLDWDPNYSSKILAKKCICAGEDDASQCLQNPQSQWFQLVSTNVAR